MSRHRFVQSQVRQTAKSTLRPTGFTLLELLVVLLLIGIITSFAVLSMRADPWDAELRRQLQRFTALVAAGSEYAVLRSQELAILIDEDRYAFIVLGEQDWEPLTDDRLLRERVLPEGMRLQLEIEDRELQLSTRPAGDNDTDTLGKFDNPEKLDDKPKVLLLSSGEVTPFSITLTVDETGASHRRRWNLFGEIQPDHDKDR